MRPAAAASRRTALGRVVEAADALEEEVAQFTGELSALLAGRGEELLGEEGVALRAGHDRVRERGRERVVGVRREKCRQLVTFERCELEHERRAGATDTVLEPPHTRGRRWLVRAVGPEQQNLLVADVVREEDEEVE